MKIKYVVVLLSVGILLVTACTCQSTEPTPTPEPTVAQVQILTENMSCHEISLGPFNCECYLTGAVKNIGDEDVGTVVVKAEFFDDIGTKIGDESDLAEIELKAGASASYSIKIKEAECPSTYEVWVEWKQPGESCFIATAAYGTSTAEEIDTLRAFRDEVLLQNSLGSQFVDFYYEVSPPVADFISEHDGLRTLTREFMIEPVVWVVEAMGTLWQD